MTTHRTRRSHPDSGHRSDAGVARTVRVDRPVRDAGTVLPVVLVVSMVLSVVVVAVATYTTGTLRYGSVVEDRSDRLAAAEAAMNDALERLRIVDGLCTTGSGDGEIVNPAFPDVNGVSAEVRCEVFGDELPPSDGWAIVVTGEGAAASGGGPTFVTSAGGTPILEGPVFVHDPARIDFRDTTIKNGALWYTDTACAGAGLSDPLTFQPSGVSIPNLTFDPDTRKVYCLNRTWDQLFDVDPPTSHVSSVGTAPAPNTTDFGSCTVWSPGRYDASNPPSFSGDNYFRSGTYVFDDLGTISLSHTRLTFGTLDPTVDEDYPLMELSNDCEVARNADPDDEGATLYIGGSTQFQINTQSHLEISGRQQGSFIVALHALDTSTPSHILTTGSGNHKESAFSGLVWAPTSKVEVGTVAAVKEAAFRGGIVIGSFEGTISAAPSGGFLIRVPTSQAAVSLLLESTATGADGGTTTIRVVAAYRPTTGDLAVESWRVCPTGGC